MSTTKPFVTGSSDKLLFTPGPLTTSRTVKQAMLRDLGSRDIEFIDLVRDVRRRLVAIGGGKNYEAVLVQGSGTFGVESVISSAVHGKLLVIVNGAYGKRIAKMAEVMKIDHVVIVCGEDTHPDASQIKSMLARDPAITHVAMVHSETTAGIVNPLNEIGQIVFEAKKSFIVDAMSSFGAVPLSLEGAHIDFMISSANKCIEGVPGFSFVLARKEALLATEGKSRSLSLDLHAQWKGLEADGQFRFTPPTHAILAFHQALVEYENEGGLEARRARYQSNYETLADGMMKMGFTAYLKPERQGPIITSYFYPKHANFSFEGFYKRLSERGFAIYPGKLTTAECFRIGTIGRLFPNDVRNLLTAIREVLSDMKIDHRAAD
jgi:2-aminoethylphosphonate-pyruvate transaminase